MECYTAAGRLHILWLERCIGCSSILRIEIGQPAAGGTLGTSTAVPGQSQDCEGCSLAVERCAVGLAQPWDDLWGRHQKLHLGAHRTLDGQEGTDWRAAVSGLEVAETQGALSS